MPARPSGLTLCSATLKTFPFKPSANSYVQASRELDLLCSHEGNHHGSYQGAAVVQSHTVCSEAVSLL